MFSWTTAIVIKSVNCDCLASPVIIYEPLWLRNLWKCRIRRWIHSRMGCRPPLGSPRRWRGACEVKNRKQCICISRCHRTIHGAAAQSHECEHRSEILLCCLNIIVLYFPICFKSTTNILMLYRKPSVVMMPTFLVLEIVITKTTGAPVTTSWVSWQISVFHIGIYLCFLFHFSKTWVTNI